MKLKICKVNLLNGTEMNSRCGFPRRRLLSHGESYVYTVKKDDAPSESSRESITKLAEIEWIEALAFLRDIIQYDGDGGYHPRIGPICRDTANSCKILKIMHALGGSTCPLWALLDGKCPRSFLILHRLRHISNYDYSFLLNVSAKNGCTRSICLIKKWDGHGLTPEQFLGAFSFAARDGKIGAMKLLKRLTHSAMLHNSEEDKIFAVGERAFALLKHTSRKKLIRTCGVLQKWVDEARGF